MRACSHPAGPACPAVLQPPQISNLPHISSKYLEGKGSPSSGRAQAGAGKSPPPLHGEIRGLTPAKPSNPPLIHHNQLFKAGLAHVSQVRGEDVRARAPSAAPGSCWGCWRSGAAARVTGFGLCFPPGSDPREQNPGSAEPRGGSQDLSCIQRWDGCGFISPAAFPLLLGLQHREPLVSLPQPQNPLEFFTTCHLSKSTSFSPQAQRPAARALSGPFTRTFPSPAASRQPLPSRLALTHGAASLAFP